MTRQDVDVTGGVDTHKDTHTAAALDRAGRVLGTEQFAANQAGYKALLAWLRSFGPVPAVGVEGTGAYGSGLTKFLTAAEIRVVEVDRPDRKTRRQQGKSVIASTRQATRSRAEGGVTALPSIRTRARLKPNSR